MLSNRVLRFLKYLLLCLVLFIVLVLAGINLPFAQRIISEKANKVFAKNNLPVHCGKLKILVTGRLGLSGVTVISNPGDTILYAGEIKVSVKLVPLIFHKIKIMGVTVTNATVNIITDPATGKLDIISLFSSGKKPSAPKSVSRKKWDISVGSVYLENVRFSMNDSIKNIHIYQKIRKLAVTFEKFSITSREIYASYIAVDDAAGGVTPGASLKTEIDTGRIGKANWSFKLKNSDLSNVHFTLDQPDKKQKMDFDIPRGMFNNVSVETGNQRIRVGLLDLRSPVVKILSATDKTGKGSLSQDSIGKGFPGDWDIAGGNLKIAGGSFLKGPYHEQSDSQLTDSVFRVTGLNGKLSDVIVSNRLSRFNLTDLSFELGNGFRLEKGQIIFNSDSTLKTTLESRLETASSHINLSLEAGCGLTGLIRSYSSVPLSAKINNTEISAGDILAFLPALAKNKAVTDRRDFRLAIDCDISGNAGLLNIKQIDLKTSKGASISFSGQIENIRHPSSAKCSITFNTGPVTQSHLKELLSLTSSSFKIPDIDPVTIDGSVDSTFSTPTFRITLRSKSGNLTMGGNINLNDKSYDLRISGSHLDLGKFTGIGDLGLFTGTLDLSGKEFRPAKMQLVSTLIIDTAGYKGYNYKNLRADIKGENGSFGYKLIADDPSFICDFSGVLNMNDTLTGGDIKGRISLDADKVYLKKGFSLGMSLEAGLNKGSGEVSGFATIKDMTIKKDDIPRYLKNLDLSFRSSDSLVKGQISSDFLKADGYYEGSVDNIINVLKEGRFRGIALLDSAVSNRVPYITLMDNMDFTLEASYNPFISLLVSDTIFSYRKIFLKIMKDSTGLVTTQLSVDKFNLGKSRGFNASLDLERNPERTGLVISADSLRYGNISLTGLGAEISSTGDSAKISLFAGDTKNSTVYDIDLIAYKSGKWIKMTTSKKQWVINGYPWAVAPGDFLIMDSKGKDLLADLHLKNDLHAVDIYGKRSEKISFGCSYLGLKMLLIPGMSSHGYDGEFSGRVDYKGGVKSEIAAQLDIDRMKMNEDNLGSMKISGKYQSDTLGNIEGSLNAGMNDSSVLKLNFRYGKKPEQRSLSTEFSKLPLIIIGSLSGKYISDLEGTIGGRIDLKPVNDKPQLDGEVRVSNLGLRLIPVSARFYLPGDIVKIKENRLLFSNFTVLDSLRNRLDLDGSVDLSDLKNITADLQVTSDNLQVMNTSPKDNPEFNGSVFVNSKIRLSGPLQKPSVKGNIVLAGGTVINYKYVENLAVSETEKMITFASLSDEKLREVKNKPEIKQISKSPDIEATLEINPNTLFNFEISKGYDIGVHISGGGFLTYSLLPSKAIDLTGMYEIREGSSELKIPGWPRKNFTITPGSSVRWDGQVDDPDLRIETTSKVRGSYVNPIDSKNREVNFIVTMKLAGRLSQLGIIFDVRSEDQYLTSVFNTMSTDERMKQAINLLIFGSVQLPNAAGSSDYMTQQINQFWESQINSFTKSAVKFVDLSMGIDSYKDPSQGGAEHTSVSVQVKKDIFKDRGSVMVSGRMNDNTTNQQSNAVIENFIFEYALDSSRTKYLKVYRQQNYEDLLEGEVIKSGVGYIYRKNYDRISDIWRKGKKTRAKK